MKRAAATTHPKGAGITASNDPPNFMFRPVRTRILAELLRGAANRAKVLSIIAPMGYGKTVLMSELYAHLQQSGERCIWIGLDERDASIKRLLRALEVATASNTGDFNPTQALFIGDVSIETRIEDLIEQLSRLAYQSTIFIDNLNSCSDDALGGLLDALIFRTRASLKLVWSSTSIPAINAGRARMEGLLRQIGFSELSLDAQEVGQLLGDELEQHIGSHGVTAVLQQTEGWPAAIRMAQIVLANAEHPLTALRAFSGSDEDIAALLNRQVLKGFTPELRQFLLRLAQLRNFSVDLCRHATGISDAEQHLDFLLRRNVFMIPLDRNRRRYRLHGLFREYLLSESERGLEPAIRHEVLKRAAHWCEQHDEWHDAIDYALSCGEPAIASKMLDKTVKVILCDRGDHQQFTQWVERLEAEQVQIGWEAHYWYVWALVFCRRYELSRKETLRLGRRLAEHQQGAGDEPPSDLADRIDHLSIFVDLFTDQLADALKGAERWLSVAATNDPYNRATIECLRSVCLGDGFRFPEARQSLQVAEQIILQVAGPYSQEWVRGLYATLSIDEGDFIASYEDLNASLARAREALGQDSVLCDTLSFVAAKCAVEMGLDDQALELYRAGVRTAHSHGLLDTMTCGFDAGIKLWRGGNDEAVSIPQLRKIAAGNPPRLAMTLSCFLIQRLLRLDRLNEALIEASRIGLGFDQASRKVSSATLEVARYRDLFNATAIQLHIATGQIRQAESLIAVELPRAQAEGRAARLVELRLAKASIAMKGGDTKTATRELSSAVRSATRGHIVRPFRDQCDLVAAVVNDTRLSSWTFPLSEQRAFFAGICNELPINGPALHEVVAGTRESRETSLAPTPREVELLRLVCQGLSNSQIADQTSSSLNTVKWHLKNLFRKLGVANRAAALARAREIGLLS